jgi:hypothetical protein
MSATFPPPALHWPRSSLRWRDARFWRLLVASALLHAALIAFVHKDPPPVGTAAPKVTGPLNVRMLPPPPAEPEPAPPVPKVIAQPRLMTVPGAQPSRPALPLPPPEPPVVQPPPKPTPAPPMSFADMVATRRAQRAPTVSEHADARAEAAARAGNTTDASINRNLATLREEGTSGVFVIVNRGSRYGTFQFRGWKREDWGGWRETIEVDAGLNGDVELAMVRRMIELIRGHYQGNFNWESHRLGRVVILSARPEDTAGLEAFLLREFFTTTQPR